MNAANFLQILASSEDNRHQFKRDETDSGSRFRSQQVTGQTQQFILQARDIAGAA